MFDVVIFMIASLASGLLLMAGAGRLLLGGKDESNG